MSPVIMCAQWSGYSPILWDPMKTHHGSQPRASKQHPASSGGQESNPLKSSSSNNFPCHLPDSQFLAFENLEGSFSHSSCDCQTFTQVTWVTGSPEALPPPWPLGFLLEGL